MENSNKSNWKWIIALALSALIALSGWVFGIFKASGDVDHRLLFAQDDMLYDRLAANEKLDMVQDARLNVLESQAAVLTSKMDMVLELLSEIRKAVK